jgi:hypothetical protein
MSTMSIPARGVNPAAPPRVHPAPCPAAIDAAWLLGHAHGAAGLAPRIPAGYVRAQADAYRDGWHAGDAGRVLAPCDYATPSPSPADESWWAGFQLGIDGVPANPADDLSPAERAAFESGHDIGHARFIEDCEREHQEWLDRADMAFCDPLGLVNEAEIDRVYGHRASEMMTGGAL